MIVPQLSRAAETNSRLSILAGPNSGGEIALSSFRACSCLAFIV